MWLVTSSFFLEITSIAIIKQMKHWFHAALLAMEPSIDWEARSEVLLGPSYLQK